MTLIYPKKILTNVLCITGVMLGVFLLSVQDVRSDGLSLSVSPTLFDMSAVPSQSWQSGVKVINNNKYPLTIYANVVNFAPQGEAGEGKFIPILQKSTEGSTLAEWITISNEAFVIPPEQSFSIPFSVHVPDDASPGGHFAAILIGTKPPEAGGSFKVSTSQIVTSLFFVRIAGDVKEEGIAREFRVTKKFVDSPRADFEVRFENKGNVHLQPQGEIVITNMWGKERGTIPINYQTHFGNVLPQSIRKFEFSWKGEQSFSDIGRYKAVLTLAYGEENRNFVTSETAFYVIPVKAGSIVLLSLITFFLLLRWSIKAYVRRMLLLAGVEPDESYAHQTQRRSFVRDGDVRIGRRVSVRAPMQNGVLDFKSRFENVHALKDRLLTFMRFVIAYKVFFTASLAICIGIGAFTFFVINATKDTRDYEIIIDNADTEVKLSSEDILYEKLQESQSDAQIPQAALPLKQNFELTLVNSSDTTGLAGLLQKQLEQKGYEIADLQSDFEKSKDKSVIVYDTELQEQALDLSKIVANALLSARTDKSEGEPSITIYIGNDFKIE